MSIIFKKMPGGPPIWDILRAEAEVHRDGGDIDSARASNQFDVVINLDGDGAGQAWKRSAPDEPLRLEPKKAGALRKIIAAKFVPVPALGAYQHPRKDNDAAASEVGKARALIDPGSLADGWQVIDTIDKGKIDADNTYFKFAPVGSVSYFIVLPLAGHRNAVAAGDPTFPNRTRWYDAETTVQVKVDHATFNPETGEITVSLNLDNFSQAAIGLLPPILSVGDLTYPALPCKEEELPDLDARAKAFSMNGVVVPGNQDGVHHLFLRFDVPQPWLLDFLGIEPSVVDAVTTRAFASLRGKTVLGALYWTPKGDRGSFSMPVAIDVHVPDPGIKVLR